MSSGEKRGWGRPTKKYVSRREFIRRTGAIGAVTIVGPPLLGRLAEAAVNYIPPLQRSALQGAAPPRETVDVDAFIRLSESLTGVQPLDRDLAAQYIQRWSTDDNPAYQAWKGPNPSGVGSLSDLIRFYEGLKATGAEKDAQLIARIKNAGTKPVLRPVAEQLIYLWYVSAFFNEETAKTKPALAWKYGPPEQYERGLVWSVMRTHAPMTPGGRYGHWVHAPST